MPVYHLPAKPAVAEALARGLPVIDRLIEVATAAGYEIGAGGLQVYPDGSVTIDADRDPSADWTAFDPELRTAKEEEDAALRQQVTAALAELDQGAALLLGAGNVSAATQRMILGKLCQYQTGLVRLLIRQGLTGQPPAADRKGR